MKKIKMLILFLALLPLSAHAGLTSETTDFFRTYGSNSRSFSNDHFNGHYFGRWELRAPVKSIRLVNFEQPSIKAGCNGVSMSGGSMSWISGEELVAFAQAVIANAPPYLFSLAMQALCPSCVAIFESLRDLAVGINKMMRNSCQAARQLAGLFGVEKGIQSLTGAATSPLEGAAGGILNASREWVNRLTGSPAFEDSADISESFAANPWGTLKKLGGVKAENGALYWGNTAALTEFYRRKHFATPIELPTIYIKTSDGVWQAKSSKDLTGVETDKSRVEFMMLTQGTVLMRPPQDATHLEYCKTGDEPVPDPVPNCIIDETIDPAVSMITLYEGGPISSFFQCADATTTIDDANVKEFCLNVTQVDQDNTRLVGFKDVFGCLLMGKQFAVDSDADLMTESACADDMTGILSKIMLHRTEEFTPMEKSIFDGLPESIKIKIMQHKSSSVTYMASVTKKLTESFMESIHANRVKRLGHELRMIEKIILEGRETTHLGAELIKGHLEGMKKITADDWRTLREEFNNIINPENKN